MSPQQLDFYFPFFVFFYGFLAVLVAETPYFEKVAARAQMSSAWAGLTQRRGLAWVSFFVGGLWSIQNLLFS